MATSTTRVIAGFGRSGTTWIQDVLAEANQLRAVFEPLHPHHIPRAADYAHRYFSASDTAPELYRLLHRYFFEEFRSLWIDYRIVGRRLYPGPRDLVSWNTLKEVMRYVLASKDNVQRFHRQRRYPERIIKFVRANMMLPWLKEQFHPRMVFVVRHPAAVVMSQMRAPRAWYLADRMRIYQSDQRLLDVLDRQAKVLLFKPLEEIEAFTLSWCIENSIALKHARENGIHVVFYENLLEEPDREWAKILTALDLSSMPDRNLISRPSQQAWGDKAADSSLVRQYGLWMDRMDKSSASRIQKVLDNVGMNTYVLTEALPKVSV